jgi:multidrug efflux pump subunit AcrB
MRKIFKYFVEHPKLVNLLLIMVLIMGTLSFINLKRNSLPRVDFKMMFVTTVYPGAAAKDVEINVTIPLEEQIQDVAGIKEMNPYSTENFSNIFIEIDPDARDIDKVKEDITKAVDRVANLPKEVKDRPYITELKSDIFPVFEVAISGTIPELELREFAETLEKKIRLLPGVGATEKTGYRKREVHVEVDLDKASANYISLAEVMAAIRATNVRLSGGNIQSLVSKQKIVTLAQFEDPMDVKDVIVRSVFSGKRILVSDIARVRDSFEKEDRIIKANGKPSINITVSKKEDADAVTVASRVRDLLEEYNKSLPAGVESQVVRDFSIYVNAMLNVVISNALIGFVLVILCLMIFLDFRVAFWTALGIPFSLFLTFYFMPIYDISVTSISLLAIVIVLGMLVDDAIVVAEHIFAFRERGMEKTEASVRGVSEIFWPVLATVTTTIAAFLPLLLMGGIFGEWLRAIPIMVTVILCASLFESVFILPSHLAHTKLKIKEKPKIIQFLERKYKKNLLRVLKRKYWVIGFFVIVFILSVGVVLPLLGFELFPASDDNLFMIKLETPKGTPIEETDRRVQKLEAIIEEAVPADILTSYVTTVGEKGTDMWDTVTKVTQSHWARIIINLTPREERDLSVFEIIEIVKSKVDALPDGNFAKIDIVESMGGPPVGKPVDVTFIGNDDDARQLLADSMYNFIITNEAVSDVTRSDEKSLEGVNIRLNNKLMAELGITAMDVASVVRAAIDGNVATSIRKEGEEIDFRVMVGEKFKKAPAYLRNLTIPNRMGKLIKLGSFIRFEEEIAPLAIWHREGDRSITIRAEMDQDKLKPAEYNKTLRNVLEPMIAKYPNMRMVFGGLEQSTVESMTDFYNALVIALIAIYIILVVLFNSFTEPLIVMLAIPFGLIGVIFAFAIHFTTLSFLGLIGILGLAGVVVNNSLVMLKFLNAKQEEECKNGEMLCIEHVVDAAVLRLRPITLTTITTVAGLLPSLYGFIGGRIAELFPLLLALTWGLVFASFITLFLIPSIYIGARCQGLGIWELANSD